VRALLSLVLITSVAAAHQAAAQGTKAPATKQSPATKAPATKAAATQTPSTKTATSQTPGTKGPAIPAGGPQQRRPALSVAPETPAAKVPVIMREVFEYDAAGRRDPFFSLLSTPDLRPTVTDLRLVTVLFDESGRRPVAVMRDVGNNTQYRVTTGMQLGRMRVAAIHRRSVIFTIEEFGLNRQDSVVLGDTTKVRAR